MKYQNGIQIFRIQLSNSYGYLDVKAYVPGSSAWTYAFRILLDLHRDFNMELRCFFVVTLAYADCIGKSLTKKVNRKEKVN